MSETAHVDVLIFVEDPGAANFLAPLSDELAKVGATSVLCATGLSVNHLQSRQCKFVELSAENAQHLIDRYQPKVIIGGTAENARTLALSLFQEGKARLIPTVGVVDMVVNADRRFRGEGDQPFSFAPDYIMVPDEDTRQAFQSLDFAADKLVVTGYPQFDFAREKARSLPINGSAARRKKIVFIAEPESKLNPALSTRNANYKLQGRGGSDFRTHIVLEEVLDAIKAARLDAHFVVRLHPKNSREQFTQYESEVAEFSQGGDPLAVFGDADLVAGITSMALQEAAWFGRRTLAVLPEEADTKKLASIANGLTPYVMSSAGLVRKLQDLQQDSWNEPDPEKFFKTGAASTMASFITRLMRMQPKELSPCS